MHTIERQLIDYGAIDTWITSLEIDSWFDKVIIKFNGKNDFGTITCEFFGCYQINLNHDRTYSKCKKGNGDPDYKYFIQDIGIKEENSQYDVTISAWPLSGKIICKDVIVTNG